MGDAQLLKISRMKEFIKPTRMHRHAGYHELILLRQGSGYHEVDEQHFEVLAPVVYYLRPGQAHCWNFSEIPKGYVILFREELLLKEDIDQLYRFPAFISLSEPGIIFDLLTGFYHDFKSQKSNMAVYSAYLHLLITILRHTNKVHEPGANDLYQLYKRKVNNHFLQNKQTGFYADLLNVTAAVLNEACKKVNGKTALSVVNERVLLEAKLLLSSTHTPINHIAHELKFTDPPHFSKFFKLNTGFTPGHYREMAFERK